MPGVPLIKNAIAQGPVSRRRWRDRSADAPADPRAFERGDRRCRPAGLAAALRLQELGRSFTIVDQGTVAHAIRSFPRDKLVFDQPLELPVVGKLWLRESTKEELLGHWLRLVRREGITVREHERLAGIERRGTAFQLDLVPGDASPEARVSPLLARHVIVAIGRRGTPRKLAAAVPADLEGDVFYHLADARSFEASASSSAVWATSPWKTRWPWPASREPRSRSSTEALPTRVGRSGTSTRSSGYGEGDGST